MTKKRMMIQQIKKESLLSTWKVSPCTIEERDDFSSVRPWCSLPLIEMSEISFLKSFFFFVSSPPSPDKVMAGWELASAVGSSLAVQFGYLKQTTNRAVACTHLYLSLYAAHISYPGWHMSVCLSYERTCTHAYGWMCTVNTYECGCMYEYVCRYVSMNE